MAAENSSVIRILKLYELLRQETDENHPMLATIVCKRLVEQGSPCDRRTLSRCVNTLNDYGYEVMGRLVGHEKGYYVMDRAFSVPELKVLIDAVQAASFITEKKTAELQPPKQVILPIVGYIAVMAICLFLHSYFKTLAARYLDAAEIYPLSQGGAVILSMAMSALFFKEKINLRCVVGVVLSFVALLLINLLPAYV